MGNQHKKDPYLISDRPLGLQTDSPGVREPDRDERRESPSRRNVPEFCTLDGFAQVAERNGGMDIHRLEPLTCLVVETDTAVFVLTVVNPLEAEVLIQGGKFFSQPLKAKLCGGTFGGSFLKTRWIGVGMQMEICCQDGTFISTPVRTVTIKEQSNLPGPF